MKIFNNIFLIILSLPAVQYLQFLGYIYIPQIIYIYYLGILFSLTCLIMGKIKSFTRLAWISLLLITLLSIQQLVWLPSFTEEMAGSVFWQVFILTSVIPISILFVSMFSDVENIKIETLIPSYALYLIAIGLGVFKNYNSTGLTVIQFYNYDSMTAFNYLVLSDCFAILSILIFQKLLPFPTKSIILGLVSLLFLALSFSRTSFLLFSLIFIINIVKKKPIRRYGYALSIIGVISAYFLMNLINESVNFQRLTSVFVDSSSDASLIGRKEFAQNQLSSIGQHIYLGRYISEWWENGERGGYIHNILSYLDSYGIFTFSAFITVIFLGLFKWRRLPDSIRYVSAYLILAILFTRSYIWPYIWIAIGLMAQPHGTKELDAQSKVSRQTETEYL